MGAEDRAPAPRGTTAVSTLHSHAEHERAQRTATHRKVDAWLRIGKDETVKRVVLLELWDERGAELLWARHVAAQEAVLQLHERDAAQLTQAVVVVSVELEPTHQVLVTSSARAKEAAQPFQCARRRFTHGHQGVEAQEVKDVEVRDEQFPVRQRALGAQRSGASTYSCPRSANEM